MAGSSLLTQRGAGSLRLLFVLNALFCLALAIHIPLESFHDGSQPAVVKRAEGGTKTFEIPFNITVCLLFFPLPTELFLTHQR